MLLYVLSIIVPLQVPVSYREKQRSVHYYDASARAESTWACVDTSDLGALKESWWTDEADSTLLGYAEREVMGHQVSYSYQNSTAG